MASLSARAPRMRRLACAAAPLSRATRAAADTENISPGIVIGVAKELRKLSTEPLEGIKVQINEDEVTDIVADITGPGAPARAAAR